MVYINILSLDRSRSTVVNLYLANIINGVALGEVSSTIGPKYGEINTLSKSICACGESVLDCKFWSPILGSKSIKLKFLKSTYSGNYIESSKTIKHSKWLRENCKNNLVGIFLIRSFNGWSNSVLRVINNKQEGSFQAIFTEKGFRKSALRLYLRRIFIIRLLEYYLTNLRLIYETCKYKNKFFIFSTDDLKELSKFIEKSAVMENHICRGNRSGSELKELIYWNSNACWHVKLIKNFKKIFLIL